MKYIIHIYIFTLLISFVSWANNNFTTTDSVKALQIQYPIEIDGILSEPIWQSSCGISKFTQRDPNEGSQPSQKTLVHVGYDDEALYIGARLYDSAPDSIIARLERRDAQVESDFFAIFIDPYLDRRSGYYFAITAAGTILDGVLMNDEWDDDSWDGIWQGEVNIDQDGWTAEIRIPYSQLRFHKKEKYCWGINFRRDIKRYNEKDYLVFTPKDGSGFVSRFPTLVGIQNINPSRNFEVLPYIRTKAEYLDVESGNPFNDGSRYIPGTDFKIGIGSNLTFDGTINPDFGQVEVDPAVVNLSDVETYFQEKRPFFIEGASIFEFGYGGSRSSWSFNFGTPTFFYSRRVGRTPQGSLPDHEYADIPDGTKILGAAKLSGKIGNNLNIGTIHAFTSREYAGLSDQGRKFNSEIEPFTYYGVLRLQNEFNKGFRGIGAIATASTRFFKDERLRDQLNREAYTFGMDGWSFLDENKMWVITSWWGMTHILANTQRMLSLQQSSRHYFQRPDANHVNVDSSATSLTGYAGRITLNKQEGNVIFNSALGFINPKFNVNDLGFFWRNDIINAHIGSGYKWTETTSFSREAGIIFALFGSLDFDTNVTWAGLFFDTWVTFLNYYDIDIMFAYNPVTTNNRRTRGGPLMKNLAGWELNLQANSDDRKNWVIGLGTFGYVRGKNYWYRSFEVTVKWKPTSNLSLSFTPQIFWDYELAQWVDWFEDERAVETYSKRYVFGELKQTELSGVLRVNWTFTPKLSFQIYLQPLISAGDYQNFKELARPNTFEFNRYGEGNSSITREDNTYRVDPDGPGPAEYFEFDNPDFNIKSLRANAVVRWEYLPGSTLYFVWTQSRFDFDDNGEFQFNRSLDRLFRGSTDNIFMVKLTYWLNM
jgi:hypothetical protein